MRSEDSEIERLLQSVDPCVILHPMCERTDGQSVGRRDEREGKGREEGYCTHRCEQSISLYECHWCHTAPAAQGLCDTSDFYFVVASVFDARSRSRGRLLLLHGHSV